MKRFFYTIAVSIALVSCSGRDASDVVILVKQYVDTVNAGAKVDFVLNAFTTHEGVVRVSYSSFDEVNGAMDLGQEEPGIQNWKGHFYYEAPFLNIDTTTVRLFFTAEDNFGNTNTTENKLVILTRDFKPEDNSGLVIHSAGYGESNGFCLKTRQVITLGTADESEKDILVADDGSLSTATNVVFCNVPDFNYAEASRKTIEETFKASVKHSALPALSVDDVFLVGRKDPDTGVMFPWGVFRVMQIYEEPSGLRLVFNYKFI